MFHSGLVVFAIQLHGEVNRVKGGLLNEINLEWGLFGLTFLNIAKMYNKFKKQG